MPSYEYYIHTITEAAYLEGRDEDNYDNSPTLSTAGAYSELSYS